MTFSSPTIRGVVVWGLALALWGCGDEVDPFSFCPEDSAAEMLKPEGQLTVDFRSRDWYSPQVPFRTYFQPIDDGSVHLAACQVDDLNQMWHLRTRWSKLPDVVDQRIYAGAGAMQADEEIPPLGFEGFLNVCKGQECPDTDNVLKFFGSLPHAVWLDQYSKTAGELGGGIVSVYMPTPGTSNAIEIYFDLKWKQP